MAQEHWSAVDRYLTDLLAPADPVLETTLQASADAGLPPINVSPPQGKLLHLLARAQGARTILEIGTLGGYSTIWLARALGAGGRVVTLEIDPHHADVARGNLERAGVADRVDVVVGRAADSLAAMGEQGVEPFDLVFVDADKAGNDVYFEWAMRLTRPGALIVVDNVVRGGAVVNEATTVPEVLGVRRLVAAMAAEPRIEATVVQTVGSKGYDGLAVGLVVGPPA